MLINDIKSNLDIIERTLDVAKTYRTHINTESLKKIRRMLKNKAFSLEEKCSVAAYGQSQVGKSYVINSLLSSSSQPFVIKSKDREYVFINEINCSGGNTSEVESTGLITRFTCGEPKQEDKVRLRTLSIADIILILTYSYYEEIDFSANDTDELLGSEQINDIINRYKQTWNSRKPVQNYISEDDIYDIQDFLKNNLGMKTQLLLKSSYLDVLKEYVDRISEEEWCGVFSLLWGQNEQFSDLFKKLMDGYKKVRFNSELYIPFEGVSAKKGTILDVRWLDRVIDGKLLDGNPAYDATVTVYDSNGKMLCSDIHKSILSALISEITFYLPQEIMHDRPFLKKMDLLDFPGGRGDIGINKNAIGDTVIPFILRRGKVAYLFNKYSRTERIASILFCHHHNQTSEKSVAKSVTEWVDCVIGRSPEERSEYLQNTNGISPLMMVQTKFNLDLAMNKGQDIKGQPLSDHWKRYTVVLPEMLKGKNWYEEFTKENGKIVAFQDMYPVRSFSFSEGVLFDGYSELGCKPEEKIHENADYPNYYEELKKDFMANGEIRKHFANPEQTWNDVATLNNDGSKRIIEKLDTIAHKLSEYRFVRYEEELNKFKGTLYNELSRDFVSGNIDEQNKKLKDTIRSLRTELTRNVGSHPEQFGMIIDKLMIPSRRLHSRAYEVYVQNAETPVVLTEAKALCMDAGITILDDAHYIENVEKLKSYFLIVEDSELEEHIENEYHVKLVDLLKPSNAMNTTLAGVVALRLIRDWFAFLNSRSEELVPLIKTSDEIIKMIQNLFDELEARRKLYDNINEYQKLIPKQNLFIPIGDMAASFFNDFVATVGDVYYMTNHVAKVDSISQSLHIAKQNNTYPQNKFASMKEALQNLPATDDPNQLQKQPFWSHFSLWKERIEKGLILTSDVQNCNVALNNTLQSLMQETENLYVK